MNEKFNIIKNSYLDYFLYKTSPVIFRILYDKYYRSDLYREIRSRTLSKVKEVNLTDFAVKAFDDKVATSVPEFRLLEYYMRSGESCIKAVVSFSFSCMSGLLYLIMKRMQLEKKDFIFLDNNRIIYNRLNLGRIVFKEIVRINIFFMLGVSMVYFINFLFYRLQTPEEVEIVEKQFNRDLALYRKLEAERRI
jgi:hypothetical protein